jgi:predicted DsbA family dithiol-disulfide isomerase
MNKTNDTVIIAHDYLCPWCWIGFFQARRLKAEFPQIRQDWRGYELLPQSLGPIPDYKPRPRDPDAPPTRIDILSERDGIAVPARTIGAVRTHDALQGAEYAKEHAPERFDAYNEAVYRAYWEESRDISSHDVLAELAERAGLDAPDFVRAIAAKRYSDRIVPFNEGAYADDITHVPSFVFRGERCAEAPYSTIRDLAERFVAWYDHANK